MASGPYGVNVVRFYMAGFRHVGDSNITPLYRMFDITYIDERMDGSKPYDIKLVCPKPKFVCTMA